MEDQLKLARRDYYMVPVDMIDIVWEEDYADPKRGDIEGLKENIRSQGVRDPIKCSRDGERFRLREGFRRMYCVTQINAEAQTPEAKILRVPMMLSERNANETDHALSQLLENSFREDATPLQKASIYLRLLTAHGITKEELSARISQTTAQIDRYLLLLRGATPIRKALDAGTIGVTAAAEIITKSKDEEEQVEKLDAAIKASGGDKATARIVKAAQPRVRAPYRTTRHLKEVQGAIADVTQIIKTKGYKTDDEAEPAVWQGYLKALEWMNGGDAPW
jgi:ParB/RepB/Spo0J family partition protein